jgi:hypothetical protein
VVIPVPSSVRSVILCHLECCNLLFFPIGIIQLCWQACPSTVHVTSALVGGGWSTPRPAALINCCIVGLVGPRTGLGVCGKPLPHRDSNLGPSIPYRLSYPCPHTSESKKRKAVPLQPWSSPEVSRKLRLPDFMTTAQDGGKVVSLTHRPPLPPGNTPGTHFC